MTCQFVSLVNLFNPPISSFLLTSYQILKNGKNSVKIQVSKMLSNTCKVLLLQVYVRLKKYLALLKEKRWTYQKYKQRCHCKSPCLLEERTCQDNTKKEISINNFHSRKCFFCFSNCLLTIHYVKAKYFETCKVWFWQIHHSCTTKTFVIKLLEAANCTQIVEINPIIRHNILSKTSMDTRYIITLTK